MIRSTFCHVHGISARKEQALWDAGVRSWDDWLPKAAGPLSERLAHSLHRELDKSVDALRKGDARYFAEGLPTNQVWRAFPDFRGSLAYLDIETTGLSSGSSITTIALYDGRRVQTFVRGDNLADFKKTIHDYDVLVTYNGKCFDIPFIQSSFNIRLDQFHIDLRYVLSRLGYTGGLKGCEHALGLDRGDLEGIDGVFAVHLWHDYARRRDEAVLETLLAYNVEDVLNLETLLTIAYNKNLKKTPFHRSHRIPDPKRPKNPFRVDKRTVARIRERVLW